MKSSNVYKENYHVSYISSVTTIFRITNRWIILVCTFVWQDQSKNIFHLAMHLSMNQKTIANQVLSKKTDFMACYHLLSNTIIVFCYATHCDWRGQLNIKITWMQLTQGQYHCVDTCFALNERTASLVSMATVRVTPCLKNSLSSIKMSRGTRSLNLERQ